MLWINEDECVGCGACAVACPAGFELVGDKAKVKDETAACVDDAAARCPRGAIVRVGQGEGAPPLVPTPAAERPVAMSPRFGRGRGRGRQRGGGRGRGRR